MSSLEGMADMLSEIDPAVSPLASAQQDSKGKLKGAGGGTTPSQPGWDGFGRGGGGAHVVVCGVLRG
jgi:hypothetical protein